MSSKISCGILLYRLINLHLEVFIVHPGGPLFKYKDEGYWSIPKGEIDAGETEFIETAKREFFEETGFQALPPFIDLGFITQKSGKRVYAWGSQYFKDDAPFIGSNLITMEYPYRSGKLLEFPEVDTGLFMAVPDAIVKIKDRQRELISRLMNILEYKEV